MRRLPFVGFILVLVALCSSVLALPWPPPFDNDLSLMSPRQAGMGGAGLAIADDANAWRTNPAGLSQLNVPAGESSFVSEAAFNYGNAYYDYVDIYGLNWSGYNPTSHVGIGAGIEKLTDPGDDKYMGLGIGAQIGKGPFSAGLSLRRRETSSGSGVTSYNLGGLYRDGDVSIGVRVDNFNRDGLSDKAFFNAGAAWRAGKRLLLAVDAINFISTDYYRNSYNFGGEYQVTPFFALRAGQFDDGYKTATTFGAGFTAKQWKIDFAYADEDNDTFWNASIGTSF